jgi:hypothetical protein
MKIAVLGAGAVGARTVRQLASSDSVSEIALADRERSRAVTVQHAIDDRRRLRVVDHGDWPTVAAGFDVAVLCHRSGDHATLARQLLEDDTHVVSVSDAVGDVRRLLELDGAARQADRVVVAGAGFAPGLSCVLAAHGAATFDAVDEIHVAKVGTGGPACARQRHHALASEALDWRDGQWLERQGGSGRELCWFPDPVGAQDCYRGEAPDTLLLVAAFPHLRRATARLQATRRDRLTSRLPMLRRPHPEGEVGALRVELRGRRGAAREVAVLGVIDRPGVAAGAVAALAAIGAGEGGLRRAGAGGLAELVEPLPFLTELAKRGVKAAVFEGSTAQV